MKEETSNENEIHIEIDEQEIEKIDSKNIIKVTDVPPRRGCL